VRNNQCECFVAYPSHSPSLTATVEAAIDQLKGHLQIRGWKDLQVTGKLIIAEVCKAIESADVVIADVTDLNHNVLFELGYAVARNRQVWPILDPSHTGAVRRYRRFRTLTGVGYAPYSNVPELLAAFDQEDPCSDLTNTVFTQAVERGAGSSRRRLLYVRSAVDTEASIQLSRTVDSCRLPVVVDDPTEVPIRPLVWYVEQILPKPPVLAHFLSEKRVGAEEHNAKASFVCGFAYGMGCRILMLAESPYDTPIDYSDLLEIHDTPAHCVSLATEWLSKCREELLTEESVASEYAQTIKEKSRLQRLSVGAYVAEEEAEELPTYFVDVACYRAALRDRYSLVVGQKGSGKSAVLYKLLSEAKKDVRNLTCVIKPVAFELEGVLSLVSGMLAHAERGFLIQSLWKFLIYTELARTVKTALNAKGEHYQLSEVEARFLALVDSKPEVFADDFSVRLESVVTFLTGVPKVEPLAKRRTRISELLHEGLIPQLRGLLGSLLNSRPRTLILVDDLDKGWTPSKSIEEPCELFSGLLDVGQLIAHDFASDRPRNPSATLQVVVFLRNDMFAEIRRRSPERDKLTHNRLEWDDPELLIRVLEARLMAADPSIRTPHQVWSEIFPASVLGTTTQEAILQRIVHRPRDLLYFASQALSIAVNRGQIRVRDCDVIDALAEYSEYAYEMLTVGRIQFPHLEELVYQFVGCTSIVTEQELEQAVARAGVPHDQLEGVVDLLCELEFLGREIADSEYRFVHREEDSEKAKILASRLVDSRGVTTPPRYAINIPYHSFLEIDDA